MKLPRLTVVVSARVPRELADDWRAAAAKSNLPMSDWLRQIVERDAVRIVGYRQPRPRRRYSAADPSLLLAVARLGSNCNQIAHAIHRNALRSERIDVLRCLHVLAKIQSGLAVLATVPASAET